MMSEKQELAVVQNFNLPVVNGNNTMAAAYEEEMEGLQMSFQRIKVPSGGGLAFEVPGSDPDSPDMAKELVGVIVDKHPVNAYWTDKFNGQNNPPACASMDGKIGIGEPGGPCAKCPLNQFGTDENGGKACKNMHRVYLLREGETIPILVTLPPTSIKNLSSYIQNQILGKNLRSYGVITKLALRKETNKSGINYSQVTFSLAGKLTPEQTAKMADYCNEIKAVTRGVAVTDDEYIQTSPAEPQESIM